MIQGKIEWWEAHLGLHGLGRALHCQHGDAGPISAQLESDFGNVSKMLQNLYALPQPLLKKEE